MKTYTSFLMEGSTTSHRIYVLSDNGNAWIATIIENIPAHKVQAVVELLNKPQF